MKTIHSVSHESVPERANDFHEKWFLRLRRKIGRNRLLLLFCLLFSVLIAANIKFIIDLNKEGSKLYTPKYQSSSYRTYVPDNDLQLLRFCRDRMLLLLGITLLSLGGVIFLFIRNIVRPLNGLVAVAKEFSTGNLAGTAPMNERDNIGELGKNLNDIAANFQEVLLLTGTAVGNSRCSLENLEKSLLLSKNPSSAKEMVEHLNNIKRDLDLLSSIIENFKYYHAQFDGQKVVTSASGTKNMAVKNS